jgi:hypothetical protein
MPNKRVNLFLGLTQVTNRIDRVVNVQYFIIIKCSNNVEHAVYGLDVREEGVAKSFSLRSTLDEPRDIGDLQISRIHGWRFPKIAEEVLDAESDFPFSPYQTH